MHKKRIDAAKAKLAPTKEELYPNRKFVDNKFIAQLEVNKQLVEFIANQKEPGKRPGLHQGTL